jgi:hypothetical protein
MLPRVIGSIDERILADSDGAGVESSSAGASDGNELSPARQGIRKTVLGLITVCLCWRLSLVALKVRCPPRQRSPERTCHDASLTFAPAVISLDPTTPINARIARRCASSARRNAHYALPTARVCAPPAAVLLTCRPQSSPALTSNPHSARRSASADFPRLRALALFDRRPLQRVDSQFIPATENMHNSCRFHSSRLATFQA